MTLKLMSRRSVVTGLLLICGPVRVIAKPCAIPKILFVCQAGTVKSAIARELLKRRALSKGILVSAESRGVHPEDHISPLLAGRLKRDKIDPLSDPLRQFSPGDVETADIVIAFDEAVQAPGLEKARSWQVAAWNSQYDDAKADTSENIEVLLAELAARRC